MQSRPVMLGGERCEAKAKTETAVLSGGGTDSVGGRVGDMGTTSGLLNLYQPELREKESGRRPRFCTGTTAL